MKPYKTLIFILLVFFSLGLLGVVFPKEGLKIGIVTLNFPSPSSIFEVEKEQIMNIDENLENLKQQAHIAQMNSIADSLLFFKNFVTNNTARFHFPNDDYTYWDNFFAALEQAKTSSKAVHLLHYGDSQIEMDRISSGFRQRLQEEFGGEGAGIVPAIQTIPSFTIRQSYSGSLARYVPYGDSTEFSVTTKSEKGVENYICRDLKVAAVKVRIIMQPSENAVVHQNTAVSVSMLMRK